jgi:hypothetical protein
MIIYKNSYLNIIVSISYSDSLVFETLIPNRSKEFLRYDSNVSGVPDR